RVVRFSYSGDLASAERCHLRRDRVLLCEHLSRVVGLLRASRITFGVTTARLTERCVDETDPDVDLASGLRRRCRTAWNLQLGRVRKCRRLLRHAVAVRDADQAEHEDRKQPGRLSVRDHGRLQNAGRQANPRGRSRKNAVACWERTGHFIYPSAGASKHFLLFRQQKGCTSTLSDEIRTWPGDRQGISDGDR